MGAHPIRGLTPPVRLCATSPPWKSGVGTVESRRRRPRPRPPSRPDPREGSPAMSPSLPWRWSLVALVLAAPLCADDDPPTLHVPVRPVTQQEKDAVEARKRFALGLMREHDSRFLEAVRAYEEAARLDPDAPAVRAALARLYFALERTEDGLAAARKALAFDADDFDTAALLARQLRGLNRGREAAAVLAAASARPALKDDPQTNARIHFELAGLLEEDGDLAGAERALRVVAGVLDEPSALLEQGNFSRDEINQQAGDTYERLGRVCLKAGQPERAAAAWEQARRRDPQRAGRLAYDLAEVLAGRNKPAEALARLDDYLATQPQGMEGYELKIKLLEKLNRRADVLPELRKAAAADAHNDALALLLAREYRRARRPDEAESIYKRLLSEGGGPDAYAGLLGLYKEQGPPGGE